MTPLPCDIEQAEAFLNMLGDRHTFQTFDEAGQGRKRLNRVLHGTLERHAATLSQLNEQGAGVFVMVNAGDGRGRKARNVQSVRAFFVDLDGAPLEPVKNAPLLPHCIVKTSPGRWHAYWRVVDAKLDDFKPVQRALGERFNGDKAVCDLPRVMRLPGFWHQKDTPHLVCILELSDHLPYTVSEVAAAFGVNVAAPKPRVVKDVIPQGERNDTLFKLACGLVRRGYKPAAVGRRLQTINTERCVPALSSTEVDEIAKRAVAYGSQGFAVVPHGLLDSLEWKALPPPAHDVILMAFRRYDGSNNGNIALTWSEFSGQPGFSKHSFYDARRQAVESGILLRTREGGNSQTGKKPDLFAIADRFLHKVSGGRQGQNLHLAPGADSAPLNRLTVLERKLGGGRA